eukprot:1137798-Pelagomonas_calceolata.AAC.7
MPLCTNKLQRVASTLSQHSPVSGDVLHTRGTFQILQMQRAPCSALEISLSACAEPVPHT